MAKQTPSKPSTGKKTAETKTTTPAAKRAPKETASAKTRAGAKTGYAGAMVDESTRQKMIQEAAYYRAQNRAFESGHEMEDWFSAEREIDRILSAQSLQ